MPIYAYKCASCGYAKDALQKISDPLLTVCPQCGKPTLQKQVTAAGFQLKGTGWYVTDFRGGSGGVPELAETADKENGKAEAKPDQAQGDTATVESKSESKSESSTGGTAPAAAVSVPSAPTSPASGGAASGD
jgi:putative FmdB family regulatory protein